MMDAIAIKRKKLYYESIRGLLELSFLTSWAEKTLSTLDDEALDRLEGLLAHDDKTLIDWLLNQTPIPPQFQPLLSDMQAYLASQGAP